MESLYPIVIISLLVACTIYLLNHIARVKRQNDLLVQHLEQRANRLIQHQERLEQQSAITEAKARSLSSSIQYASRIQKTFFCNEQSLQNVFPDSFALVMAKEEVCGDFFWVTEKYDTIYVAVADCTGHGIPGAFMSIIANTMLKDVVQNKGVITTSNILAELRQSVIAAINHEESGRTCEGLDISLLSFNRHTQVLNFSGAFHSLMITRTCDAALEDMRGQAYQPTEKLEESRLYELKGDRQPIGPYHGPTKPFHNYTVKLLPGDRVFTSTDGFVDQFGGTRNKKLKRQNFRQLILRGSALSMSGQRTHLQNEFLQWKGDNEQNDDVCVLGIAPMG